ncbi:MAG: adenylyltransferase/cytidyltransferase family protein, partial [Oscillospiraceae bacterium]
MKSNKVGILGGSFNPVHNGHISLATQLCNGLNLDKVMFIPTNI